MLKLFILSVFFIFCSTNIYSQNIEIVTDNSSIKILDFYNDNFQDFVDKKDSVNKIHSKFKKGLVKKKEITQVQNTNLFKVKVGNNFFYASPDLDFIFSGNTIKLFPEDGVFQREGVSESDRELNRKILAFLNKEDLIHYQSIGFSKGSVFVFVDYTCPFCKKFHEKNISKINEAGYSVYYVPFLRNPNNERVKSNMYSIFCHADNEYKKKLIEKAFQFDIIFDNSEKDNECNLSRSYFNIMVNIGEYLNIEGTPTSLFFNGNLISGHIPINQYISVLEGNN